MDDIDSLSLGCYPANSPGVSSPAVLGDVDVDPISFSQCKLDSDEQSVCCAVFRLFKVGDIYFLDELKRLAVHFGLMWNFVISRSGSSFRCNRYNRPVTRSRKVILRKPTPIACGCGWCIRFNWVIAGRRNGINCFKITYIFLGHIRLHVIHLMLISWYLFGLAQVFIRSVQIRSCLRLWFVWVVPIVLIFNLWSKF